MKLPKVLFQIEPNKTYLSVIYTILLKSMLFKNCKNTPDTFLVLVENADFNLTKR